VTKKEERTQLRKDAIKEVNAVLRIVAYSELADIKQLQVRSHLTRLVNRIRHLDGGKHGSPFRAVEVPEKRRIENVKAPSKT